MTELDGNAAGDGSAPVKGLISVIIPVYNGERYISHAINSALKQTYRQIEVVVVDDGSSDGSADIVSAFGGNVRLVRQANGGVASARNAGINVARGEFIAFLDQDDWWDERKLEQQLAVFASDPNIGVVHSLVTYYDAEAKNALPLLNEHARTHEIVGFCFERLLLGNSMYNSSVVVRRAVLNEVGLCDLSIPGNTVQDYDLWLRCAKRYPFGLVPHSTAMLRIHADQGIWNRPAMLEAELGVLFKNRAEPEWRHDAKRRTRLANIYDSLGVAHMDTGAPQRARPYFRKAYLTKPSPRTLVRFGGSLLPLRIIRMLKSVVGALRKSQ